jgi:acyl carrier protein phosphodiesterase
MNYLAHLFLAGESSESMIGNLAGDFVKGRLHERFPPAIREGIVQHRRIDAFTDAHPEVARFRRLLEPDHRHFSRVIADVFFDHFLARDFTEWSGETLEEFLERVYAAIDPHVATLPERLSLVYPRMRDEQWLLSYREVEGIRITLARMSHRIARRPRLETAVELLAGGGEELEQIFRRFFPDVIRFARCGAVAAR